MRKVLCFVAGAMIGGPGVSLTYVQGDAFVWCASSVIAGCVLALYVIWVAR